MDGELATARRGYKHDYERDRREQRRSGGSDDDAGHECAPRRSRSRSFPAA